MSNRVKFFIGHLMVSAILAILIILWVFFIWYPSPLAKAVGVTHIFMMMLAIDVILGPLLGFVVYKEKKKTLKFDLTVIIIIQILALTYGVFNIAQARPVWIVFNEEQFELIQANSIIKENLDKARSDFQVIPWLKPQYTATEPSLNKDERNSNSFDFIMSGISIAQRPERFVPLSSAREKIGKSAKEISLLGSFNNKNKVEDILKDYPMANAWLPLKASAVDMVVLINKEKGEVVKIVDLRPWK